MENGFLHGNNFTLALDYAPEGWRICDGSILQVNQNQALYALIGNRYGGSAPTTFALPDLRSRVPVGMGQSSGNSNYAIGAVGGKETVQLTPQNLPQHTHPATFTGNNISLGNLAITNGACNVTIQMPNNATDVTDTNISATPSTGANLGIGASAGRPATIYSKNTANVRLGVESVTATGTVTGTVATTGPVTPTGTVTVGANTTTNAAIGLIQPYQVINYIICVQGIFPVRP